jgi:hypothetical protein
MFTGEETPQKEECGMISLQQTLRQLAVKMLTAIK